MPIQHYLLQEQTKGSCYITINGELGQSSSECQIIMYLWSTLILFLIVYLIAYLKTCGKLCESWETYEIRYKRHKKFNADPKSNLT
jgi:hypothetical protein